MEENLESDPEEHGLPGIQRDDSEQPWTGEKDRNLVETLLHLSENTRKTIRQHPDEMCAWANGTPNLRYPVTTKRKHTQKVSRERSPNVSIEKNTASEWPGSTMTEDHVPEWKLCVESRTCRYIQNNGKYRTSKLTKKLEIHRNVRRVTEKMTPEQKYLQKEIQRELRREFEMMQNKVATAAADKNDFVVDIRYKDNEQRNISAKQETDKPDIVQPEVKPLSRDRGVEEMLHLPPITVPLVVGKNMLHRNSTGEGLHPEVPHELVKHPLYTRGHDHRLPVRSLSEPPSKREKMVSPQALTYETFSIKTLGRNNKQHHLYSAQESKPVDNHQQHHLNSLRRVPAGHHLKEITVSKRGSKHHSKRGNKYQLPVPKQVAPLPMDADILTGHQIVEEKNYIDITTLANKPPDPFITQILPEIMGRKITGCTQDI